MGDTCGGLPAQDAITFIELGEEHGVEVHGPDSIVGFFETDVMKR
ncbi:MAG: hypothetical protein ABIT38_21710 [Gemmatimonadaceae bacterium]